jgi:protein SCO1/2
MLAIGQKKRVIVALLCLAVTTGVAAYFFLSAKPKIPNHLKHIGHDFTLDSASGSISLHDYHGDAVLLYFGYTHCPDACPMALDVMSRAIHALPAPMQSRAHGLFISLDPRRDTPAITDKFARFFGPAINGVTGEPKQLEKIARLWHVAYSVPAHPEEKNYAVSHSTFIYLVNPDGNVVALFDEKIEPSKISSVIRLWLN